MKKCIALSAVVVIASCQNQDFGACSEINGSVSPACLYSKKYEECKLPPQNYEIARENAWLYFLNGSNSGNYLNTGTSQDLGESCRFYIRASGSEQMEPNQWMVYINKNTLSALYVEPILY